MNEFQSIQAIPSGAGYYPEVASEERRMTPFRWTGDGVETVPASVERAADTSASTLGSFADLAPGVADAENSLGK